MSQFQGRRVGIEVSEQIFCPKREMSRLVGNLPTH
jgi:hypothetical protein